MARDDAYKLLTSKLKRENMVKHCLAVEAIMREFASRFNGDRELWGLTGLLHDIDFDETFNDPKRHGVLAAEYLKGLLPEEALRAIISHNFENTGVKPESVMEKALIVADALSGLIVACALVMPHKKLSEVKVETIEKKFKAKDFARGVSRERISLCKEIGLSEREAFEIGLQAMLRIADKLGL
ncbi:MAG: phosphohydrolase [Candidatus Methanomethylicota archaeon]|uniref:Phosphohydrolase n=1 Tax=Thermoproteota archaeon TaxID=2056631 RepID=A0A497ERK9_9CREN|nr:MAG: phosphohydrolase [Candidatus Verstraetearchaeota archaeon]RLE53492.1 MAG: phosphohydrolase [Candidatus Verstraetearchaeota archaeon]